MEVCHLVFTAIPFENGFENLKRKKIVIKLCWCVFFAFGLFGAILGLEKPSNCLALYYEEAANERTRFKSSCDNLCNIDEPLDCSMPKLTLDQLLNWSYVNSILLSICFLDLVIQCK